MSQYFLQNFSQEVNESSKKNSNIQIRIPLLLQLKLSGL